MQREISCIKIDNMEEESIPSKVPRLVDEFKRTVAEKHYAGESSRFTGEILKQWYGYSSDRPLKVTMMILASQWNSFLWDHSLLCKQLAIQLAEFPQVKVTFLVPENSCNVHDKRDAASYGVTIVEAKEQSGFDDPIDWLNFPPQELTTDIVVGVGERLGKIAQIFKQHHQCKSIYVASDPFRDWFLEHEHFRQRLVANRTLGGLSLERNVGLSKMADLPVAIGPKTYDEISRRCHNKEVFKLTPGTLKEFSDVKHATADGKKFRILSFGSGNPDNFHEEGLYATAKAIAQLDDTSYHLVYTSAAKGMYEKLAKKFDQCGVAKNQLSIRSPCKSEEELKRLFHEADLAIIPSGEQGFGMVSLAALSAGLPVLVHGDSGFGEALRPVAGGAFSIVDSEDPKVWAKAITKNLQKLNRKTRLEQAAMLRSSYDEKYSWEEQCGELVKMILSMVSGGITKIPLF